MADRAEWKFIDENEALVIRRQVNVIVGCLAYFVFGFILYACIKQRVFAKRIPDVLLILIVAFITDLAKTRMYLYFIFNLPKQHTMIWTMPTTISACTLGLWTFFVYFTVAYVEAIISIHRFIFRFIKPYFSTSFVFIGVGIVFALQATLFFETFLHGSPVNVKSDFTMYCTKAYTLKDFYQISTWATVIAMTITPIISMVMAFKRPASRERGVSAFIFLSSLATAAFAFAWLFLTDETGDEKLIMIITYFILDFRFPLLCLMAIMIVGDIRRALFAIITRSEIEKSDDESVPELIENPAYLESCVYPHGKF